MSQFVYRYRTSDLTERQFEIFCFIYNAIRDEGYQPSYREIGRRFSIGSTNGVKGHMDALSNKGYVRLGKGVHANLRLLRRPDGSSFQGFAELETGVNQGV